MFVENDSAMGWNLPSLPCTLHVSPCMTTINGCCTWRRCTKSAERECIKKAAYNNEMDFSLWQVQWEEVVCNCNKFNKVQALMIGHQSNETIYTALCTIADVAFMTYYGFASVSSFFFSVNIRVSLLCPCPNAMSIL